MISDEDDSQPSISHQNKTTAVNILLLGETGVGKSTFINSIANYLTYFDFDLAEQQDLKILIPSKFKVTDKNGVSHEIETDAKEDSNEFLETGVSATQDVKTYVFPIENRLIRFIDTPGMGDTRGIDQDDINCENILSYISQLDELHAIAFLFKSTNSRITAFFEYCVVQILSRLDKSASNNLLFLFTNTRGTDYRAGETLPILEKVVANIKQRSGVEIPLKKNIFCFDNEAFKYLAAVKKNVEFIKFIRQRNKESWQMSLEQCLNAITYIVGNADNKPLTPHNVKSTNAINEAKRMITQLSQPLAEISQLINDNLNLLERHQENLNLENQTIKQLQAKLYMPVINLQVTELSRPVTVCTSTECSEVIKVGETKKWHYKQRCHDPCGLANVPKELVGSPELLHCWAMDRSGQCRICKCKFSVHMHIYYTTQPKEDRIVDANVQSNISSKEKILQNAKRLMDECARKKRELEKEHQTIVTSCARFAHFLENNAITPFSDSYKEYIEYLITREKSLGNLANKATLSHLKKLLQEYQEKKKSFDEALKHKDKIADTVITPQQIQNTIQELYKLKHNGKKIKELYECQQKSRQREHEYTEYVHQISTQIPVKEDNIKKPKKKRGKKGKKQTQKSGLGNLWKSGIQLLGLANSDEEVDTATRSSNSAPEVDNIKTPSHKIPAKDKKCPSPSGEIDTEELYKAHQMSSGDKHNRKLASSDDELLLCIELFNAYVLG